MAKHKSLLRSTTLVSFNTFISRVLGFVREMMIAYFFGATGGTDAFNIAFRIPNLLRGFFAEGAFAQAFVPLLSKYATNEDKTEARRFISNVAGSLGTALLVVTIIGVLAAPWLIKAFAPGFTAQDIRFDLAVNMLRITFPYLLFISLAALTGAILNTYDNFGIPSFTPVFLNITLIIAPMVYQPIYSLAWGVFIAGIIQFAFQLPFLKQQQLLIKPRINFFDAEVINLMKLMVPALFGVSVTQINVMINSQFASFLQVGSISWLGYADRLMNFPLGVFGVAIATVMMPRLSRHHIAQDTAAYSSSLDWSLKLLLIIGLPCTIGMLLLAQPLITTLLHHGQFKEFDVLMTSQCLMAYAIGIQAFMVIKVLAAGFYARRDIRTPVKIAFLAMLINIALNAAMIKFLAHIGLALATSLAAFVNAGLLLIILIRRKIYVPQTGWQKFAIQLIVANVAVILFLLIFTSSPTKWIAHGTLWCSASLSTLLLGTVIIYLLALYLTGMRVKDFRE